MGTDEQKRNREVNTLMQKWVTGLCDEAMADEIIARDNEIVRLRTLAKDAYDAWQHDRDMRVGKLLLAMMDTKFSATYRPDLVPNIELRGDASRRPS